MMDRRTVNLVLDLKGSMREVGTDLPQTIELDGLSSAAMALFLRDWLSYRAQADAELSDVC